MDHTDPWRVFHSAYNDFVACVNSLTEAQFLEPMDGWAARDVVAHLIGWNRFMIQACTSILAGEAPAYYLDAPADYANINSAFVEHYASRSRPVLLRELALSKREFEAYIASLSPAKLSADLGVIHYSGQPATLAKIIRSLGGDYQHHTRQITTWVGTR